MPHSQCWAEGSTPSQGPGWGKSTTAAHSVPIGGPAGVSTEQTWGSAGLAEQRAQEGKRWQQVGELFLPPTLHRLYKNRCVEKHVLDSLCPPNGGDGREVSRWKSGGGGTKQTTKQHKTNKAFKNELQYLLLPQN